MDDEVCRYTPPRTSGALALLMQGVLSIAPIIAGRPSDIRSLICPGCLALDDPGTRPQYY